MLNVEMATEYLDFGAPLTMTLWRTDEIWAISSPTSTTNSSTAEQVATV